MVVSRVTRIERHIASLQPRCAIVDFYRKGRSFAVWTIWAWAWVIGCVLAGPLAAQPASVGAPLSKVGCRLDGVGCSGISQLSYSSNVLSLTNGTSHQAIRIYYTDDGAGNAEWLSLTSNDGIYSAYNVAAGASGTGVAHPLIIGSTGPAVSVDPSDDGYLMYSGSNWFLWRAGVVAPTAGASNAADLGIVGTNLWRSGFFGTSVVSPLFVGIVQTSGTAPTVANTTADSCGTTAATIAGNDAAGIVTVGATAGTVCRIAFVATATTRRVCSVSNETTANLARVTYVDTTHSDLNGTFVAGDVLAYQCSTY